MFPLSEVPLHCLGPVDVSWVSSLNTTRGRWTINLYRRSCFKTNNQETTFSGTERDPLGPVVRAGSWTGPPRGATAPRV